METTFLSVAVLMQRTPLANRWQPFQWKPFEISADPLLADAGSRCLRTSDAESLWLFGGFAINLYPDEAEGYYLNISSPAPCWFVMWRMETRDGEDIAVPKQVTLSYNEAARLMDGGEQVDALPASLAVIERLTAFVQEHYRPEPKKKRRKPSFEGGAAVEEMARAEGTGHGR
jgi:hypothetical protein